MAFHRAGGFISPATINDGRAGIFSAKPFQFDLIQGRDNFLEPVKFLFIQPSGARLSVFPGFSDHQAFSCSKRPSALTH